MRDIDSKEVTKTLSRLFQEACHYLPEDVLTSLKQAREAEESPVAREVLDRILEMPKSPVRGKYPYARIPGMR